MIKDIEDGVYISDLVRLHTGVKTVFSEFSLQASGLKIKDGKLDHPIKMIVVSGNFFTMMNSVKSLSSDLNLNYLVWVVQVFTLNH